MSALLGFSLLQACKEKETDCNIIRYKLEHHTDLALEVNVRR